MTSQCVYYKWSSIYTFCIDHFSNKIKVRVLVAQKVLLCNLVYTVDIEEVWFCKNKIIHDICVTECHYLIVLTYDKTFLNSSQEYDL